MANLPKKKSVITVDIEDSDGVAFRVSTLADEQVTDLLDSGGVQVQEGQVQTTLSTTRLVGLFRQQVVGADDLQIDGEPFNPDDDEHIASVPLPWKMEVARALMEYSTMDRATGKNLKVPDTRSTRASTQPEPSTSVSAP